MENIGEKLRSVPMWVWVAVAVVVALVLSGVGGKLLGGGKSSGVSAAGNGATTATTADAATSQSLSDMSYALQQQQEAYTQQIVAGQKGLASDIGTGTAAEIAAGNTNAAATQGMLTSGFGKQAGALSGLSNDLQALSASQAGGFSSLANQVQGGFANTAAGQQQGNSLLAEMQAAMANFHVPQPVAAASQGYTGAPGEQNDTVPAGAPPTFGNQTAQIQQDFLAAYGPDAAAQWQQQHNAQVAQYGS